MIDSSDALAELLTLTLTVDQWGNRIYRNSSGERHRHHGPAVECANGTRRWYQCDQLHRIDGPAMEYADGDKWWHQYGKRHRTDGAAIELANGTRRWYLNGEQFTEKEFHERFK